VVWPVLAAEQRLPVLGLSAGRPAGRATMVSPGASTGTAQHTAKSASSRPMLRQGMTSSSCMYGAPGDDGLGAGDDDAAAVAHGVALDDVHVGVGIAPARAGGGCGRPWRRSWPRPE
jgi:hypothetical protein